MINLSTKQIVDIARRFVKFMKTQKLCIPIHNQPQELQKLNILTVDKDAIIVICSPFKIEIYIA